uniref:Uncharacterized protein n=1 Tax=Caenorhabditis japonica TaxID=281687 RepID=A0A8R1I8E9_CAEJA
MNSSLVMVAAVFNSYLTRQPTIPEITTENVEEKEESVVAKKSPKVSDQEDLMDDNMTECFLEFLFEFFN